MELRRRVDPPALLMYYDLSLFGARVENYSRKQVVVATS